MIKHVFLYFKISPGINPGRPAIDSPLWLAGCLVMEIVKGILSTDCPDQRPWCPIPDIRRCLHAYFSITKLVRLPTEAKARGGKREGEEQVPGENPVLIQGPIHPANREMPWGLCIPVRFTGSITPGHHAEGSPVSGLSSREAQKTSSRSSSSMVLS